MAYKDYLQTNWWKKRRISYMSRYEWRQKCFICSSKQNLQVHHRRYKSNKGNNLLFNERDSTLMTLCNSCHKLWHEVHGMRQMKDKQIRRLNNLLDEGATASEAIINCMFTYREFRISLQKKRLGIKD